VDERLLSKAPVWFMSPEMGCQGARGGGDSSRDHVIRPLQERRRDRQAERLRPSSGTVTRSIEDHSLNQPDDDLRSAFRDKIIVGDLPKVYCRMTLYGPGTGGVCVACGQRIRAEELEVECDLPKGGTIRLHRTCYDVWTEEWPSCDAVRRTRVVVLKRRAAKLPPSASVTSPPYHLKVGGCRKAVFWQARDAACVMHD
jgi:hypothetical protein